MSSVQNDSEQFSYVEKNKQQGQGQGREKAMNSPLNRHLSKARRELLRNEEKIEEEQDLQLYFVSSDPVLEHEDDFWPLDTVNLNGNNNVNSNVNGNGNGNGNQEELEEISSSSSSFSIGTFPSLVQGAIQIVQKEGEMVHIPAGWWHQVYHLAPSIAVAGQYCNSRAKNRTFSHMLEWCGGEGRDMKGGGGGQKKRKKKEKGNMVGGVKVPTEVDAQEFSRLSERQQVLSIIELALQTKYGTKERAQREMQEIVRISEELDTCDRDRDRVSESQGQI